MSPVVIVLASALVVGCIVAASIGRRMQRRFRALQRVVNEMQELAVRAADATALLGSARQVTSVAQGVLANAESTQRNNQIINERIRELTIRSQRIVEILEVIKDVANKSELLALNAALEGSKAGEAGRGFSLVASQMQRLAESVMGSVRDIKDLTAVMREATNASVLATEEGRKLAADTTRSARQITEIVEGQQGAAAQVTAIADRLASLMATVRSSGARAPHDPRWVA
ncbi:MAG: methyl-accepting chemotaxis protein [Myxococcota bacterium]|nr:methyl-accepting chemotaxis protein [Myxococcota bacterium]